MKIFFKTNIFIWFLYFETQQLKNYSSFIFLMFDANLIQNNFLFGYVGSMPLCEACSWYELRLNSRNSVGSLE